MISRLRMVLTLALAAPVMALAQVDLANTPLQAGRVKPNLMLLFDDSSSMKWSHTGDDVAVLWNKIGYRNHLCNAQYYNPDVRYPIPPGPTGSLLATPSFSKAPNDGFVGNSTTDLSDKFSAVRERECNCEPSIITGKAHYYRFTGTAAQRALLGGFRNDASNDPCNLNATGADQGPWKYVVVSADSGPGGSDERQNFANWYSYWRTRMLAMKSAISLAFQAIDEQFRVGFTTINLEYTGTDSRSSRFLALNDFNGIQRSTFLKRLQDLESDSGTPLRVALSRVGRMYGGKLSGPDPLQYSCQRNFVLLATDGQWNEGAGKDLNNRDIDNPDACLDPPKGRGEQCGGAAQTLADVAAYYRLTDLRPGDCKLCTDNVPEKVATQSMRSFAIGLGLRGQLTWREDYDTATSGDYADIAAGRRHWPDPTEGGAARVDDLWHAAVNGDGHYFNTQDMGELQTALRDALASILFLSGADAPASYDAASLAGNSMVYASSFRSPYWDGNLVAYGVNPQTQAPGAALWSARDKLDARIAAGSARRILLWDASTASKLKPFAAASLTPAEAETLKGCGTATPLPQCATLSAADQASLNANLVDWLSGKPVLPHLYRNRPSALGDIVNSAPTYMGPPAAPLSDPGYLDFAASNSSRRAVVFAGANDGMLHAFAADTGEELWAYIPPAVLPGLKQLAARNYPQSHRFFVDGSVLVADICVAHPCSGANWRSILIGGFNAGARGYYALDVTDPAQPKGLWNFNADPGLGKSYGNPILARGSDGSWLLAFASGYNNDDGVGRLYVLDAASGALRKTLSTGVGTATVQAGLARLAQAQELGTVLYGGDLLGNLWRFDIDPAAPPAAQVSRRASFSHGAGSARRAQPITTTPVVVRTLQNGAMRTLVAVGTGSLLGSTDALSRQQQSFYVFNDDFAGLPLDDLRAAMVERQVIDADATRGIDSRIALDWSGKAGWYLDFPTAGERVNVDPVLSGSLLTFAGNLPTGDDCASGSAWFYAVDLPSGSAQPPSHGSAITRISTGLLVGVTSRRVDSKISMLLVSNRGEFTTLGSWEWKPLPASVPFKRVSWRELVD